MAGSSNFISDIGSFVGTTNVWDVSQLYDVDINSDQFKELLVRLYQTVNNIALALNTKESGYYPLNEFMTGQIYFQNTSLRRTDYELRQYLGKFIEQWSILAHYLMLEHNQCHITYKLTKDLPLHIFMELLLILALLK
jgi:hypothetical protein